MATALERFSCSILLLSIGLAAAVTFGVATAHSAEVKVRETSGAWNTAELIYRALPGESNRVTITSENSPGGYFRITVKDAGSALVPGAGCSGGGGEVHCRMHEPKWQDTELCGKGCSNPTPGTGWTSTMRIFLGDEANSFDGSSFTEQYLGVDMSVESGAGADDLVLGAGEDRVDPGAGADEVHTGPGFDRIKATAVADGPDLYDSGTSMDKLSYERREEPVYLADSTAGGAGEGDRLAGSFHLIGGTANDILEAGPQSHGQVLDGGPGSDILLGGRAERAALFGGSGSDRISTSGASADSFYHLVGEGGNDTYLGGEGSDWIFESFVNTDGGAQAEASPFPESSGGDDIAYGHGKRDMIALGTGADRVYGGGGDDEIDGEGGADRLRGGPGQDQLVGGSGFDGLYGELGSDRLYSGRTPLHVPNFVFPRAVDDGRDHVDCGPGRDIGNVNPWDRRFRCETTHLLRHRAATGP
ncbi:MAG TPA: calcium-binding protein [Solirubrobacterales bacterium]